MRSTHVGLLLVLIPTIGSAAFLVADWAEHSPPAPTPKTIEIEQPPADPSTDGSHSQTPAQQPSDGEVIGVPLLA
jgi:hypothetical protein